MLTAKSFLKMPHDIWTSFITYLPGRFGMFLRQCHWKRRLKFLGENVRIETGVYFQNPQCIHIDDNVWIDRNVTILAGLDNSEREKIVLKNKKYQGEPGTVHVGKNIHIGIGCIISGIAAGIYLEDECGLSANCKLYAFSHHYRSHNDPGDTSFHFGPLLPAERQCLLVGPIYLGRNTGVALNAVILPGASVEENCFIGINSVVNPGRYKANSVISGNPAKVTDSRFEAR